MAKFVKTIPYLDSEIKVYDFNRLPVMIPAHEYEKLIETCNKTGKTISQIIRLQSKPCCNCNIITTEDGISFKRISFNSKKNKETFNK